MEENHKISKLDIHEQQPNIFIELFSKEKETKILDFGTKITTQMLNSSTKQQEQIDMYTLVSECSHSFFKTTRRAK